MINETEKQMNNINDLYKEQLELSKRLKEVEEAIKVAQLTSKYKIRPTHGEILNKETNVGYSVGKRKDHHRNNKKDELVTESFRGSDYVVRDLIAFNHIQLGWNVVSNGTLSLYY